jgi:hypothetical protein
LAAVSASAILVPELPEVKVENVAVLKTSIVGPSGNITQEQNVPVVTQEAATIVENPALRIQQIPVVVGTKTVLPQQVLPIGYPPQVVPVHQVVFNNEVPVQSGEVPVVIDGQTPFVVPQLPVQTYPYPQGLYRNFPFYPNVYYL